MASRIAAALLAAFAAAAEASGQQQEQVVRTRPVEERMLARLDRVTGTLRAANRAVIAALEAGPLVEVRVKEAALVAPGDVLARTDTRRLDAQRGEAEAQLEVARAEVLQRRAELEKAERDLEAMAAAAEKNAVSRLRLRQAQMDEAVARARLGAAEKAIGAIESRIELLDVRIDDAMVRAPFSARVVERHAEPGEWIRPGDPILTLISTGTIEAWLEVPERYAGRVARYAGEVAVHVSAVDGSHRSVRTRVVPQVHPRARTFALVADLADDEQVLTPGMSVTAWLPVGEETAYLTVPKDALVRREGLTHVYRVAVGGDAGDGGYTAEHTPVTVLFETGDMAVLGSERPVLSAGDRVVVEGNERLLPGSAIDPRREDATVSADRRAPAVAAGLARGGKN